MNAHLLTWLLAHGWHVWPELHFYFSDHSRGGWIEWLASRPRAHVACVPTLHDGQVFLNGCRRA